MKGTVKFFHDEKGWGFVTPDDGGKDIFVHQSDIVMHGRRTLREGEAVEYVVEDGEKGQKAVEVKPVDGFRPFKDLDNKVGGVDGSQEVSEDPRGNV